MDGIVLDRGGVATALLRDRTRPRGDYSGHAAGQVQVGKCGLKGDVRHRR